MRKVFYSISVFLFLCLLSLGYYHSYGRITAKKEQNNPSVHTPGAEPAANNPTSQGDYGIFYLKEKDGYVMVYERDKITLFEPTIIPMSSLPESLRREIAVGKYVKTQKELYSFLENYST